MTNADTARRKQIDMNRYTVERRTNGVAHMWSTAGEYDEPRVFATIRLDGRTVWSESLNATMICLPDRSVRAIEATDAELILGIIGDESVFA